MGKYYTEFHIHQQANNQYDMDEADAIIFSKETEHLQDAKCLDELWDVIEAHPELDDLSIMVEAFIKELPDEEEDDGSDVQTLDDLPASEGDDPVVDGDENTDESSDEDAGEEWLEDWKIVCFADVLRIADTPSAFNSDANAIYREGSTLSVKAYEEGELPNINGMISQLGAEDRMCAVDENGNIVLPGTIVGTVDDLEDSADDSDGNDGSGDDEGNAGDGNVAVGDGGDVSLEP